MATAIRVDDVSKRFRLYQERYHSLKERAIHFGKTPFEEFWAVRDVTLEIEQGTTVGLLGANGSGKSTLLKCICGILRPTSGEVSVRGRMAALLELGAGFQPELTGRENVYLNGAILGMSQRSLEKRFDDIVAFAELEQFIDTQVRFYSSGMYVRLGFAVAVNVDPDVLVVDEVLAVGDEAFQRKCFERMRQFQRDGRTIVFVTHVADWVRQFCDSAAVLEHGALVAYGSPGEAVRSYREHLLQDMPYEAEVPAESDDDGVISLSEQERKRTFQIRIESVEIANPNGAPGQPILPDASLEIVVRFESKIATDDVNFGIAIYDLEGRLVFGSNTRFLEHRVQVEVGHGEVCYRFDRVPLLDGTYMVTIGITDRDEGIVFDWQEQHYRFEVMNPGHSAGLVALPLSIEVTNGSGTTISQQVAR